MSILIVYYKFLVLTNKYKINITILSNYVK